MLYKKPQRCFWLRLRGKLREVPLSSVAREFEMAYRAFRREKGRKSSTDAYLCNSSFSRACNVDAWNNAYKKWMLRLINPDSEVWLHTHPVSASLGIQRRERLTCTYGAEQLFERAPIMLFRGLDGLNFSCKNKNIQALKLPAIYRVSQFLPKKAHNQTLIKKDWAAAAGCQKAPRIFANSSRFFGAVRLMAQLFSCRQTLNLAYNNGSQGEGIKKLWSMHP